jgi:hypothetical protein
MGFRPNPAHPLGPYTDILGPRYWFQTGVSESGDYRLPWNRVFGPLPRAGYPRRLSWLIPSWFPFDLPSRSE